MLGRPPPFTPKSMAKAWPPWVRAPGPRGARFLSRPDADAHFFLRNLENVQGVGFEGFQGPRFPKKCLPCPTEKVVLHSRGSAFGEPSLPILELPRHPVSVTICIACGGECSEVLHPFCFIFRDAVLQCSSDGSNTCTVFFLLTTNHPIPVFL